MKFIPIGVAVGVVAVLFAATMVNVTGAQAAAVEGAGGMWTPFTGWLGNYIATDGSKQRIYCIDIQSDSVGSGGPGAISDRISPVAGTRSVSGDDLQMINYVISTWGQTDDPVQAAAVGAAVYNFTSANHYGNGGYYIAGPKAAEITAKYAEVMGDTKANYNKTGSGSGVLKFTINPTDNYVGTMVAEVTGAIGEGSVTLTNGVFADTGSPHKADVVPGHTYAITGIPLENGAPYRISGIGSFSAAGITSYESEVTIYSDEFQRTAGPGNSKTSPTTFDVTGQDESDRRAQFAPVVGTRVASDYVAIGETFTDILTFSTQAENGLENRWYRGSQGYAPITAVGTLYGPALAPFAEADVAPGGVPIAASGIKVTTNLNDGPNIEYSADSGVSSTETGYYTWVWTIRYEDQDSSVKPFLAAGYQFTDRFGQISETHVTPTRLEISTKVLKSEVVAGEDLADDVTVKLIDGGWLQDGHGRIPVTLSGTAYYSATEPVPSAIPPATAEPIGSTTLAITSAGTVRSEPLAMPYKPGWVSLVWCIRAIDQSDENQGKFSDTCDGYGVASETVKIKTPIVTTQAKPESIPGESVHDTALVDGYVPEGSLIEFELYKQPDIGDPKYDENGNIVGEWSQSEIENIGNNSICEIANLVKRTEQVELAPGENSWAAYDSPEILVDKSGTYWWIENLLTKHRVTKEEIVLSRGKCGLPAESTVVGHPQITTRAQDSGVNQPTHDTAEVTGPIPAEDTGIIVQIYVDAVKQQLDGSWNCSIPGQRSAPITITQPGIYDLPDMTFMEPGRYGFVEHLTYTKNGITVEIEPDKRVCVIAGEQFDVLPMASVATGGALTSLELPSWLPVYFLLPLGFVVSILVYIRKRKAGI